MSPPLRLLRCLPSHQAAAQQRMAAFSAQTAPLAMTTNMSAVGRMQIPISLTSSDTRLQRPVRPSAMLKTLVLDQAHAWVLCGTPQQLSTNCRTLKSLDSPLDDAASVALLLVPNASCGNTTSSTTSTTSTRSRPSGTGTLTGPWGTNGTGIWPTGTSRPTGWSSNYTVNATSYTSSIINTTTTMSSYTPSSGTGTVMPIMTSNSTCPASTVTSNYTITAVIISSVTQYANATITSTDFVTNTVVETATTIKTKKSASTVTVTQATTDTKTITETDFVNATATVTQDASTVTITQKLTSTETDTVTTTETDTITSTETDTVTTTTTDYLAAIATETDLITIIPTAVTVTITPTASNHHDPPDVYSQRLCHDTRLDNHRNRYGSYDHAGC